MGNNRSSIQPIEQNPQSSRAWLDAEEDAVLAAEKYWMTKFLHFRGTRKDNKFWEAIALFRKALAQATHNPELLDRPFGERVSLVGSRSIVPVVDNIFEKAKEMMDDKEQREWVWTKWAEEQAYREGRIFRKTLYEDLDKDKNDQKSDWICPICLEDEKSAKIWLECGHAYHNSCWTDYYQSTHSDECPKCRKKVHWYSNTKHSRHAWEFRTKGKKGKRSKENKKGKKSKSRKRNVKK